jgi:hypothetical protein
MSSMGSVADTRTCEQCGKWFVPLREYARFCSADCRAAWNREHIADPTVDANALEWSIPAMREAGLMRPISFRVYSGTGDIQRLLAAYGCTTVQLARHRLRSSGAVWPGGGGRPRSLPAGFEPELTAPETSSS